MFKSVSPLLTKPVDRTLKRVPISWSLYRPDPTCTAINVALGGIQIASIVFAAISCHCHAYPCCVFLRKPRKLTDARQFVRLQQIPLTAGVCYGRLKPLCAGLALVGSRATNVKVSLPAWAQQLTYVQRQRSPSRCLLAYSCVI